MSNKLTVLYTERISKTYDHELILDAVSLQVKSGEIYGILGPNGAGKTTLLKMLAGFIRPSSGKAFIRDIEVEPNKEMIQRDIGSLIETPIFYENLSGSKNLEIHLKYMDAADDIKTVIENAMQTVGLSVDNQKPVSKYSLGMRQRLAIARSYIHHPKLLILDEPVNGLDPIGLMDMRKVFGDLAKAGMTIIISSHLLNELRQIADSLLVITDGTAIIEDTMEHLEQLYPGNLEQYLVDQMRGA